MILNVFSTRTKKLGKTTHIDNEQQSLLDDCRKGDSAAFKKLYEMYAVGMFSICMRMLNHTAEAEDVLQESFIAAFKNIHNFDGKASFGAWLKRIVINNSINQLKKRKISFVDMEGIAEVEEETEAINENMEYSIEAIKDAVQQLPDGYRTILTLYLFEDYSHRMIAEKLNISESTSKSQYLRARKKLAGLIKQNNHYGR